MNRKRLRKLMSVDQNTGEILDGLIVYCGVKRNAYAKGWVMNSQESLEIIAKDRDLTGEAHRVLWYLLSRLDFENWIQVTQREIAEELGLKKQNASRSIAVLTWMKYKKLGFWTRRQGDKGTRGICYRQSFSLSPPPLVPPFLRAKVYLTQLRTAIYNYSFHYQLLFQAYKNRIFVCNL